MLTVAVAVLIACAAGASGRTVAAAGPTFAVAARSIQPGELAVVTVRVIADATAVRVKTLNEDVSAYRVEPRTWRALVGIDLDVPPGTYPLTVEISTPRGLEQTTGELHVRPKRFPVRRLRVDPAFVNPPAEALDRIAREGRDLQAIWATPAGQRFWTAPFVRPVPGAANSRFGTRSIFNGEARNPHGGADLLSPAGTPILAPAAGRIRLARNFYYSGNTVVIDHGLGLFSLLAHLSEIDVEEGTQVTAGTRIGLVGATGRVTGPHLHWAVRVAGARVDPIGVLALLGPHGRFHEGR